MRDWQSKVYLHKYQMELMIYVLDTGIYSCLNWIVQADNGKAYLAQINNRMGVPRWMGIPEVK